MDGELGYRQRRPCTVVRSCFSIVIDDALPETRDAAFRFLVEGQEGVPQDSDLQHKAYVPAEFEDLTLVARHEMGSRESLSEILRSGWRVSGSLE